MCKVDLKHAQHPMEKKLDSDGGNSGEIFT